MRIHQWENCMPCQWSEIGLSNVNRANTSWRPNGCCCVCRIYKQQNDNINIVNNCNCLTRPKTKLPTFGPKVLGQTLQRPRLKGIYIGHQFTLLNKLVLLQKPANLQTFHPTSQLCISMRVQLHSCKLVGHFRARVSKLVRLLAVWWPDFIHLSKSTSSTLVAGTSFPSIAVFYCWQQNHFARSHHYATKTRSSTRGSWSRVIPIRDCH